MKYSNQDLSYLRGEKFSNGYRMKLVSNTPLISRIEFLKQEVHRKKILHIGCYDHIPLIDKKRKNGEWLHDILTSQSQSCIGIDNSEESINYVKKLGGVVEI